MLQFQPNDLVEFEQKMEYGVKAEVYEFYDKLSAAVEANSPTVEIKRIFDSCTVNKTMHSLLVYMHILYVY